MFADVDHPKLTRRFAIGTREVLVFDGLFTQRTQRLLYQRLRGAYFHWGALDSFAPKDAHAVRWRQDIDLAAARLPFFTDVIELIDHYMPGLVVDRIYTNFNLYGEVHNPHIDAKVGVTALYCANLVWKPHWQGETFFYERGEPAYAVAPKPGRLVVFDGALTHRGSPPARDCFEPRINIAFKLQRKRSAPRKRRTKFAPIRR
jgi:hypothetical protein